MATWFVTGASKGLGLALVKKLLDNNMKVAATSRSVNDLIKAVGTHENFLPLQVNLGSEESIGDAIEKTVSTFGSLDVVVNNAGYGLIGAVEELDEKEVFQNIDVNLLAVFKVIKKALPHMRAQGAGHIFNISSMGGYVGFQGAGSYNAAKFAVVGLSEALAVELAPFNIRVTIIAPGFFRTEFLADGSLAYSKNEHPAYAHVHAGRKNNEAANGQQAGDPDKLADIFIEIAASENPPLNLAVGSDAYSYISQKVKTLQEELDEWKAVSASTDFK